MLTISREDTQQSTFGHATILGSYATARGRHCGRHRNDSYATARGRYYGAAASPAHNARHPPRGYSQRQPSHVMMRPNGGIHNNQPWACDNLKIVRHCRHCSSSLPSLPRNHARRNPSRRRHKQNVKHTTINLGACDDSRIVRHYPLDTLRSSSITCVQSLADHVMYLQTSLILV